jgi:predicted small secreted protein
MFRKIILLFTVAFTIFLLAGCNTMAGVGRDVQWLGRATADTADSISGEDSE